MIKDVGKVIAFSVAEGEFQIENTSTLQIRIESDSDIQLNCGCSSLVPEARSIQPRDRTTIKATVRTAGRVGPFAYGGTITWTSLAGDKRAIKMTVRGVVEPPFTCQPDSINFLPLEVRNGVEKEVTLSESVIPLDWNSLEISSSCKELRILPRRAEGNSAKFDVKCAIPEGLETFECALFIKARVRADSPLIPGASVSHTIHVLARQNLDLSISPKIVPVTFRKAGSKGTARLLLRGDLVNSSKSIVKSITCSGYAIEWKIGQPINNNAVLELVFGQVESKVPSDTVLRIELLDREKVISLPIVQMYLE